MDGSTSNSRIYDIDAGRLCHGAVCWVGSDIAVLIGCRRHL